MTGGQNRSETLKSTDRMNSKPHEPLYCMYLILAWYTQEEIYFRCKLMKQMKNDEILQQQVLLLSSWVVTDDDLLAG